MSRARSLGALLTAVTLLAAVAAAHVDDGRSFASPDARRFQLAHVENEYEEATERFQHRFMQEMLGRPLPGMTRPGSAHQRVLASQQVRTLMRFQESTPQAPVGARPATWRPLGPDNVGGRSHSLVIDPRDHSVMYMGGIAGGVWKSNDAGKSWRPLNDTLSNIAVSSLAIDPEKPDTVYAGTGDVIDAYQRLGARGAGIMVTTDAGSNWRFLESTQTQEFRYVNTLKFHPTNGNLFAASDTGLHTSNDDGATWRRVLDAIDSTGCFDIDFSPDGNNVLVSCGIGPGGVFRSTDAGQTWQRVISEADLDGRMLGRIAVASARSRPEVAYASISDPSGLALALMRSDQGGAAGSWQVVNASNGSPGSPYWFGWCDSPEFSVQQGQGMYDNVLAVDPTNPDRVFVGGIDIFRSDDGGRTLHPISYWWLDQTLNRTTPDGASDGTQYVHADQHGVAFHPNYDGNGNTTMYWVNDGGLFRTDNATAPANEPCHPSNAFGNQVPPLNEVTWTGLNAGFATTLIREGFVSESGAIAAGLQDNGTILDAEVRRSPNDWIEAIGGDGAASALDPSGQVLYGTAPGGIILKYQNGDYIVANTGITDRATPTENLFVIPLERDLSNPDILWAGLFGLWRTTDGAQSWTQGSPALPAPPSAIGVSPRNSAFVLAGTRAGGLWRTTTGLDPIPTWEQVGQGLPTLEGYSEELSAIAIDPSDDQVVYVTVSSFKDVGKVFKSTDGGRTFTRSDGSGVEAIPDTAAYAVAINPLNPSMIYVGTDSGVFESLDAGATWRVANDNLATTTVEDLFFRPGTSELYAFTYGRGAYSVDVGDVAPPVNDEVETAAEATASDFRAAQNTRRATTGATDPPLPCGPTSQPQQAKSVWYKLTSAPSSAITVSTEESNYDTVVGVFDASTGSLEQVACDDNSGSEGTSRVTFDARQGGTYYIEVARSAEAQQEGVSGHLVLQINQG